MSDKGARTSRVIVTVGDGSTPSPHVTIRTLDRNLHVCPVATIESMIAGALDIDDVDDGRMIVRSIMRDWLDHVPVAEPHPFHSSHTIPMVPSPEVSR